MEALEWSMVSLFCVIGLTQMSLSSPYDCMRSLLKLIVVGMIVFVLYIIVFWLQAPPLLDDNGGYEYDPVHRRFFRVR